MNFFWLESKCKHENNVSFNSRRAIMIPYSQEVTDPETSKSWEWVSERKKGGRLQELVLHHLQHCLFRDSRLSLLSTLMLRCSYAPSAAVAMATSPTDLHKREICSSDLLASSSLPALKPVILEIWLNVIRLTSEWKRNNVFFQYTIKFSLSLIEICSSKSWSSSQYFSQSVRQTWSNIKYVVKQFSNETTVSECNHDLDSTL